MNLIAQEVEATSINALKAMRLVCKKFSDFATSCLLRLAVL